MIKYYIYLETYKDNWFDNEMVKTSYNSFQEAKEALSKMKCGHEHEHNLSRFIENKWDRYSVVFDFPCDCYIKMKNEE